MQAYVSDRAQTDDKRTARPPHYQQPSIRGELTHVLDSSQATIKPQAKACP